MVIGYMVMMGLGFYGYDGLGFMVMMGLGFMGKNGYR